MFLYIIRSHLKKGILVQDQGGSEFQPAGIRKYVEDLKEGPNAEIGLKDFFEIASNQKAVLGWPVKFPCHVPRQII